MLTADLEGCSPRQCWWYSHKFTQSNSFIYRTESTSGTICLGSSTEKFLSHVMHVFNWSVYMNLPRWPHYITVCLAKLVLGWKYLFFWSNFYYFYFNPLKSSGSIRTSSFNLLKLYILPTECISVFHMVLTINRYFSLNDINRLAFVGET
jgi:hypothetical protein